MVPARNLLRRHYDSYGGFFGDFYEEEKPSIRPSFMAEEPSRGTGEDQDQDQQQQQQRGERDNDAATTSKEADHRYENWLRLGIGAAPSSSCDVEARESARPPTELELFSDRPSRPPPPLPPVPAGIPPAAAAVMPLFPPAAVGGLGYRRDVPWGFLNPSAMMGSGPAAPPPLLQYNYRQFLYPPPGGFAPPAGEGGLRDVRVVSPPRRPQAGVWFVLQAAQNQAKEPFLPQIPKSYLRIKDGRMTVRLLMKYLVSKLGLENESEVEITCRGQPLHPLLTLQQVRDSIWCSREAAVMLILPDSPSTEHVMTLHYRRSA